MAELQSIGRDTPTEEAMAILDRDGAVIFERVLDDDTMDAVQAELDSYHGRSHLGEGEFWGFKTKRVGALVAKSRTSWCPKKSGIFRRWTSLVFIKQGT